MHKEVPNAGENNFGDSKYRKLMPFHLFRWKMYFSYIIVICLAICLHLIRALPTPADTSQIAVSSKTVGTDEETENVRAS